MVSSVPSTTSAVSVDSGEHWSAEGAWTVADGVYRVPLPLPLDGLTAVNVYVIEGDDGLTLIDGGWAIDVARETLDRSLRRIGYAFTDIRSFLVTHVHRDHYTLASVLGREHGAQVWLGRPEKPSLDLLTTPQRGDVGPFPQRLAAAGAQDLAGWWASQHTQRPDPALWQPPDVWMDSDQTLELSSRSLDAIHTPGHTPGHFVFGDRAAALLFAGDHVLPTITPSIGFTAPTPHDPLGAFMFSLAKVRALPDLQLLPAHGPVAPSSHRRIDELLAHHEERLTLSLAGLASGSATPFDVARTLPWTRRERTLTELDNFNQSLAVLETKAHLDLLVARGEAVQTSTDGVVRYAPHLAKPGLDNS